MSPKEIVEYNRYFISLARYLFWLTGDMENSKDIAQNTFIKIMNNPELFDNKKNFKVWLFAIAKNKWKNDFRARSTKLKFEKKLMLHQPVPQESAEIGTHEQRVSQVNSAIENLSDNHKEVIVLKYTSNFTIEEMAEILECSEGTVKSRLFYAIKDLKKITGV